MRGKGVMFLNNGKKEDKNAFKTIGESDYLIERTIYMQLLWRYKRALMSWESNQMSKQGIKKKEYLWEYLRFEKKGEN